MNLEKWFGLPPSSYDDTDIFTELSWDRECMQAISKTNNGLLSLIIFIITTTRYIYRTKSLVYG